MKEKLKAWFKKNWKYVVGGVGVIGLAASGMYFTNNWMNILKTDWRIRDIDGEISKEHLTAYEALCVGKAMAFVTENIKHKELISEEQFQEILNEWTKENPEEDKVLWDIGFWRKFDDVEGA